MSPVVIEPAGPADRGDLVALLGIQLEEHGVAIGAAELGAAVDGVLADPARGFFLCARDGGTIGLAYVAFVWTLEHGGPACWLEELYVVPERREAGIGQRLLEAALARARASGCRAMDLEVDASHQRAARLYRRNGFRALERVHWTRRL